MMRIRKSLGVTRCAKNYFHVGDVKQARGNRDCQQIKSHHQDDGQRGARNNGYVSGHGVPCFVIQSDRVD